MAPPKKASDGYHHGDLRAALLRAAVELIAEHGVAKLSLRECARHAGVSHAAPYRHFESKDALLVAIAEEGFAWLHEAGRAAMDGLTDPRKRLDAYGVAYVRFALEHPVHHRVMFTLQPDDDSLTAGLGREAFELLQAAAVAVTGPEVDPRHAAVAAWSIPHGLSMLILDGRVPAGLVTDEDAAEDLARAVLSLWRGPLGG
ncbi:TetR/AcrR family transcriptional regulator [Paraliomyxa miuraensis]|uniref:TetR/AcrR family transcriptional regulator n=1 Tax=Paraliomyxa miuraensis TaxID=376150 RepID=UPI0022518495|nr:TetR/AcrR family transcriptional regulator [Paraliomyxa miuraensis]MCX4239671.1 TetR/AcrR family transcriptional regulator [Paraliomyxa miuraensis]